MTPEEKSDFAKFGCVSRSIIKLCDVKGLTISDDDFVERYRGLFVPEKFGALTVDRICDIVRDLAFCSFLDSVRDSCLILKKFRNHQEDKTPSNGVFLLSDKNDQGEYIFHCRLVLGGVTQMRGDPTSPTKIDCLLLFDPISDGSVREYWISLADLERELPHYLVLQP
jgi:hypothetical protein